MKFKTHQILKFLMLSVLLAVIISMIIGMTGCSSSKFLETSKKDSTATAAKDSGAVKSNTSSTRNNDEWWREIVEMSLRKKDTNVVNVINTPGEVGEPIIRIIREGGKNDNESNTVLYDSSWKNSFDSLQAKVNDKTLQKETEVFGWQYAAIIGGVVFLIFLAFMGFVQYNLNKNIKAINVAINQLTKGMHQ